MTLTKTATFHRRAHKSAMRGYADYEQQRLYEFDEELGPVTELKAYCSECNARLDTDVDIAEGLCRHCWRQINGPQRVDGD